MSFVFCNVFLLMMLICVSVINWLSVWLICLISIRFIVVIGLMIGVRVVISCVW